MLRTLCSFVLLAVACALPAHAADSRPRATAFDSGQLTLTQDGYAASLPPPPIGATGFHVAAQVSYDFALTCENRNREPLSFVEMGGQFVLECGGAWLVECYGATPQNIAGFDGTYWNGPDCRTQPFSTGTDALGHPQFVTMSPTYVCPLEWWTGELVFRQQGHGVEGWLTAGGVWHGTNDWTVPYSYSPVQARVRGWIVWEYGTSP